MWQFGLVDSAVFHSMLEFQFLKLQWKYRENFPQKGYTYSNCLAVGSCEQNDSKHRCYLWIHIHFKRLFNFTLERVTFRIETLAIFIHLIVVYYRFSWHKNETENLSYFLSLWKCWKLTHLGFPMITGSMMMDECSITFEIIKVDGIYYCR